MEADPIHPMNCILQSSGRYSDAIGEITTVERRNRHLAHQSVELYKEFPVSVESLPAQGFMAASSAENITCGLIHYQRPCEYLLSSPTYYLRQHRVGRLSVASCIALLIHELKYEESYDCGHCNSHNWSLRENN